MTPTPATIREAEAKDTSRAAAFERFKQALAAADISPTDRYRIHIAGCEYASAAAHIMSPHSARREAVGSVSGLAQMGMETADAD